MRRCVHCGGIENPTKHHVGGQNFIGWFTMTLCERCQQIFHAKQRAAGIDLRSSSNPTTRLIRALKMTFLFIWLLLDMLEKELDSSGKAAEPISKSLMETNQSD